MMLDRKCKPELRHLLVRVRLLARIFRLTFWGLAICGLMTRIRVEGLEHIPRTGAVLVYANHPTAHDPLRLFSALRSRDATFLAKAEMFHYPAVGRLMRFMGMIPVAHGSATAKHASDMGVAVLRAGSVLIVFPEGGHTKPNERLGALRNGVAYMVQQVPHAVVVPAAIIDSDKVPPRGWRRLFGPPATVRFGPPLPPIASVYGTTQSAQRTAYTQMAHDLLDCMLAPECTIAPDRTLCV